MSGCLDAPRVAGCRPMRIADEVVGSRSNAIIRVRPRRNRDLGGHIGFGRERSPTNLLVTFSPRHPGWGPLMAWYPAPAGTANSCPSSVMVRCPAETLVRVPIPSAIGPDPVPILVRPPIVGYAWPKTVTVVARLHPAAFRRQIRVKDIIIVLIGLRNTLALISLLRLELLLVSNLRSRSRRLLLDSSGRALRHRHKCCR